MISVVIISNTANESIQKMTQECIDSIHSTSDANIVVVDMGSDAPDFERACSVKLTESFNFNKFLNIGINYCLQNWPDNEYIVLANNDLVFLQNWLEHLVPHFWVFDSLSPKSPGWPQQEQLGGGIHEGWNIGTEFAGWCLVFKTKSLKKLLPLDEQFEFWFADNDMVMSMKQLGMRHALVSDSHVKHLFNKSHGLVDNLKYYTINMAKRFNDKWQNYN